MRAAVVFAALLASATAAPLPRALAPVKDTTTEITRKHLDAKLDAVGSKLHKTLATLGVPHKHHKEEAEDLVQQVRAALVRKTASGDKKAMAIQLAMDKRDALTTSKDTVMLADIQAGIQERGYEKELAVLLEEWEGFLEGVAQWYADDAN